MNDKQLLQMLEVLGKNSRIARSSKSLAASEVVAQGDRDRDRNREGDTRCAATLRKIITGVNELGLGTSTNTNTKSLAGANPNPNVNKIRVLTQFIFRNGKSEIILA